MSHAILEPPVRLHADEALILLGIGGFGRRTLQILGQEFARLGMPEAQVFWLGVDAERASRRATDIPDSQVFLRLQEFDRAAYLQAHPSLQEALSHLPSAAWPPEGCSGLPGLGLLAFHHDDETHVTRRLLALIDEARAKNPQRWLRCCVVFALDDAFAGGAAVPHLFRDHEHMLHRKVALDVFLAVDSGEPGRAAPHDDEARACVSVASAMLWERVLLGDQDIFYPGKDGVREDRLFRGPLQTRTWIFSENLGSQSALASVVAGCIETLAVTPLSRRLEAERVRYAEDLLERVVAGSRGARHPTALLSMAVAGLKVDCLPAIVHLRAARRVVEALTQALTEQEEEEVRGDALRFLAEAGIVDKAILSELRVGENPFTVEEIDMAPASREGLHAFVNRRLQEDLGTLLAIGEGMRRPVALAALLERLQAAIAAQARALAGRQELPPLAAMHFYRTVEKQIEAMRQRALARQQSSHQVLATTGDRKRLEALQERLLGDTKRTDKRPSVLQRFASTITISVPTQLRKIVEVASGVRANALDLASATLLSDVFVRLLHFCEKQREELQGAFQTLHNVASLCAREEERVQRASRSAFTYRRARFEALIERLAARLGADAAPAAAPDCASPLRADLLSGRGDEEGWFTRALESTRPDLDTLAAAVDAAMAAEPLVREAIKESLTQFRPSILVDRDRFATLETERERFVLCTRRLFAAHEDLFDGFQHLETENPFNILVTEHEEGLPFLALASERRHHETYRVAHAEGRTTLAHAQAACAKELPLLDE